MRKDGRRFRYLPELTVQILNRDSQSNPNRASEVAAQLINNDKVDIMIASSTSDTTNPVADQCELAGVPYSSGYDSSFAKENFALAKVPRDKSAQPRSNRLDCGENASV